MKNIEIAQNNSFFEFELSTEKLVKNIIIAATLLTTLNTSEVANNKDKPEVKNTEVQLSPDLSHISKIESNSGKNKNHKLVRYGLNKGHRAAGLTGLMPITIKETISKNTNLNKKYGSIINLSATQITSIINSNETIDKEIANAHWNRLSKLFPRNEEKRAYAWKNGITGAIQASDRQISEHPYVRKFIQLKYNKLREL
jgi:hypothetical protein